MASKFIKFVDVTKCNGCRACMVACKNWNDLPAEPEEFIGIQSHKELTANTWNYIAYIEKENKSRNAGLDWFFAHMSCLHCNQAACEKVCPEGAISQENEFGAVVIDYEKCTGCGYCVAGCQFNAIKLGSTKLKNGKTKTTARKCTLCIDRLENNEQPACAMICHSDAIEFGDRKEILVQAEERLVAVKERYPNANIYNPKGLDGLSTVYLLAEKPEVYGLPNDPKLSTAQVVWKDYALPFGKVLMGATAMAVVGGMVSNKLFNPRAKKGGDENANVQEHE